MALGRVKVLDSYHNKETPLFTIGPNCGNLKQVPYQEPSSLKSTAWGFRPRIPSPQLKKPWLSAFILDSFSLTTSMIAQVSADCT